MSVTFWITGLFNGVSYGALLFLLAGGSSLIFGMMRIVNMTHGLNMWLEENGITIAGRKVEVIVEDSQGQPNVALTKLQKLVESDRSNVLVGEVFAHIGYAMAPKVDEYRIPMVYPVIAADDLTQRKPAKWVVRTGWASSQPSHPFGEYAAKTLGYKRIAIIAIDYAFGWEVVGGFQKTFEENGGQIVQKLWAPLGDDRLRAVPLPAPARRGRGVRADGGRLLAALPEAVRGGRASRARSRSSAAAPPSTSSCCPPSATRPSVGSPRCSTAPPSTRR